MIDYIKKLYQDNPDIIIKEINDGITIIYFESICSSDKINEFITKPLVFNKEISAPNTKIIKKDEIDDYLSNAYAITLINKKVYASEVTGDLSRSIDNPESEPSVNGPKDAFTENIHFNLGLVKRRIKCKDLVIKNITIGKYTNTLVQVLYLENQDNKNIIGELISKLKSCSLNGIIDSSSLSNYLQKDNKSIFPLIKPSERPDEISNAIIENKIIILVDNSPFQLILPSYFTDFINPVVDRYTKAITNNFVKIIRYLCLIITLTEPAYYIATINYNQEAIPTTLLINFMNQRQGVPFPSVAEAIIMLIIYEIMRESDLRFPSKYGTTISILGALILGEAAVKAGIVSPIMIITIAICFISSFIFTNPDLSNALRIYRFLFLISASIFGLYGILLVFIYLLINLCSTYSFGNAYTTPLAPFKEKYFFKYIWRRK